MPCSPFCAAAGPPRLSLLSLSVSMSVVWVTNLDNRLAHPVPGPEHRGKGCHPSPALRMLMCAYAGAGLYVRYGDARWVGRTGGSCWSGIGGGLWFRVRAWSVPGACFWVVSYLVPSPPRTIATPVPIAPPHSTLHQTPLSRHPQHGTKDTRYRTGALRRGDLLPGPVNL